MEIQTKKTKTDVILNLHGDIDLYNSSVLGNVLTSRMNQNSQDIIVDLSNVDRLDTNAINVLRACSHNMKQRKRNLRVINSDHSEWNNSRIIKTL